MSFARFHFAKCESGKPHSTHFSSLRNLIGLGYCHHAECHYDIRWDEYHSSGCHSVNLSIIMLIVIQLSVILLSVIL